MIPVTPARLGISSHDGTAGSLLPMPEPAVEPVTLPNVPSRHEYPWPGWLVAGSCLVPSLPKCEGTVVFGQLDTGLWSWVLPGLWLSGWPSASSVASASRATALGGAGSIPCTMGPPTGHPWDPARPQPSEGTASCPLSPVPLHPCSDPPPHPCLPSLTHSSFSPWIRQHPHRPQMSHLLQCVCHLLTLFILLTLGLWDMGSPGLLYLLTSAHPCSLWGPSAPSLVPLQHKPFPVGHVTCSLGKWSCGQARGTQAPNQALGRGADPRAGEGPAQQLDIYSRKSTGGTFWVGRVPSAPAPLLLAAQGWKHSTGSLESGRMLQLMGQRMPRRPRDCWQRSSAARHTARQGCSTPPSGVHLGTKRLQMSRRRCW